MKTRLFVHALFLVFSLVSLKGQTLIKGSVTDGATGELLVGATVVAVGATDGGITDSKGAFEFEYKGSFPLTLKITYFGYESQQIDLAENGVVEVLLKQSGVLMSEVVVTARRRNEELQEVPISVSVLNAAQIDNSVSFSVNRVKELLPSVQLYSSNPRNTTLNIRGLGSTFGLTNDGLDPGVGFYVDGVYFARPAATTLDFIDVQQIEVLRGPQGTLFGKNTTAGAFNITSRRPTFSTSGIFEQNFGNYGFIQTKGSISGPLVKDKLAVRLSYSGTHREGNIYNQRTDTYTNTLNNQGVKAQLLFLPSTRATFLLTADYTRQRPDGYALVFAGVAPTERAEFRQFENIIADLNYDLPTRNPFDRIIDHDTPWRSDQDMGGVALNGEVKIGKGVLTSTSAWRYWLWGPSNDRDFTGLQALSLSQAPSIHHQWSQEVRYAGDFTERLSGVLGLFAFYQRLDPVGSHTEESGRDQWRFVQNNQNPLWQTPGLLDGYGIRSFPRSRSFSGAVFANLDWKITDRLLIMPGIRLNYDQKEVDFRRETYGGVETDDPALLALRRSVYSSQAFQANITDWNLSGQLTANYKLSQNVRAFGTYSIGFKPVGLNLGGLPTENGEPILDLAVIEPERVNHYEFGIKSEPNKNSTLNLSLFNSDISNYQTTVRSAEVGVNRGYIANAEQVRVRGAELEGAYALSKFRLNAAVSYTEGIYVSFTNAPVPLEETGGANFKDISGESLPGISKWAFTGGAEAFTNGNFMGKQVEYFAGFDMFYRSAFSSSPSASAYLNVDGYTLLNPRIGFRASKGVSVFLWVRNMLDANYFEQLQPAGGNAGHYAGVLGDPRTFGVTLRYSFFE